LNFPVVEPRDKVGQSLPCSLTIGLVTRRGIRRMIMQLNIIFIIVRIVGSKLAVIIGGRIIIRMMCIFLQSIIIAGNGIMGWQLAVRCFC